MCGRYSLKDTTPKEFITKYGAFDGLNLPRYNRAPGQAHPIIIDRKKQHIWTSMNWGSFPGRSRHDQPFFPINARSETVTQKKVFEESIHKRRCLVPADGWYEWQLIETQKYPFYHQLSNHTAFAIAGIWSQGTDPNRKDSAFSILTRSASPEILHIHHRAPLVLPVGLWDIWLKSDLPEQELLKILGSKQPPITFFQVGPKVNSTSNDGPDLLEPEHGRQSLLF